MYENPLTRLMLKNRGLDAAALRAMDCDEHGCLLNIDDMVRRLADIRSANEQIVILPDFDMDGIMSGVIGFSALSEMGFNVALFLPDPQAGYGIGIDTVSRLRREYPDATTILTCDVGISAMDGIMAAQELGFRVLVTDHHMPDGRRVPAADCIVDPYLPDDSYRLKSICGAHVLYQVMQALVRYLFPADVTKHEQIRRLRVFAGIGTVSDGMTLIHENRQLVRDAVSICRLVYANDDQKVVQFIGGHDVYRRAFFGLWHVLHCLAGAGKIKSTDDIDEDLIGFYIAPMFNSVKRIGGPSDMENAFGVFFGANPADKVQYLYQLNVRRKELVEKYMAELSETSQPLQPYVYKSSAPAGILGLLAQRKSDESGLPCVVLTDDGTIHGSGRSPFWYAFMTRMRAEGFQLAGHDVAFGCGFSSWSEVERFSDVLKQDCDLVRSTLSFEQLVYNPDFVISHDGDGDTHIDIMLFLEYLQELGTMHPFGSGFPVPDVELRFTSDEEGVVWSQMGSAKQHVKVKLAHGFEVLLFNQPSAFDLSTKSCRCVVRGRLGINEFRGQQTVQFVGTMVSEC